MKFKIYKYMLDCNPGIEEIHVPTGARIISVMAQNHHCVIYAEVPTDADSGRETRVFEKFTTGTENDYPEGMFLDFIGTVSYGSGTYVIHVYEHKRWIR